jgi:hypothetical protein
VRRSAMATYFTAVLLFLEGKEAIRSDSTRRTIP